MDKAVELILSNDDLQLDRAKLEELETTNSSLSLDNQKYQRTIENLQRKLEDIEREVRETEQENQKLNKTVETLKSSTRRLNDLEKETTDLEAENHRLDRENKSLVKEVNRLKNTLEEPPHVLEISVTAPDESIPTPQSTNVEPDVEEEKESSFPAEYPPESPLPETEQQENPSVKLIYPYKEGQWSPLNPGGTKRYDTEFLKKIQDSPLAKITPNIPAEISSTGPSFKQPGSLGQGRKQMSNRYDTAGADAMSPAYLRSPMQGGRTPLPQRPSQGKGMHRPTVINIPVARPKAAFPKVENAWVPDTYAKKKVTDAEEQKTIQPGSWNQGRKQMSNRYDTAGADTMSPAYLCSPMQGNRTPFPQCPSQSKGTHRPTNIPVAKSKAEFSKIENAWVPDSFAKRKFTDDKEQKTNDLKKAIRSSLNKLTPENFEKISKNIVEMEVDTEERLSAMVQIFFDQAADDLIYAPNYAEVCKLMFETEVPSASGTGKVSFRKLLLDRCQQTFEKEKKDEEEIVSKRKTDAQEKKKELQMELDKRIAKTKRIRLGNIRFIGELFKLRMLTIKIMNFCISKLLKSCDEEQLECLCKLISTIGKTYEEEYDAKYQRAVAEAKSSGKQLQIQLTKLDAYLDEMRKLSQNEDLSSRIRFMLMDVLDLKQNRWVPRREGEKPKTIDEIRHELEKERIEKELSLQEDIIKQPQMGYPSQRRDGGRGDERKKPIAPPYTSPYGSFQQQPRMTAEMPQVSPSMGSPYQQNAYQRPAPGNPPFLAHAMPFQPGLPIDQAQTQMVYLSYPNPNYPQLIPQQLIPQQHQFPAAIPQSRPQYPRYTNQSQPFVQPRFSQSNNPAQYFTPFPHTNGQVPLQVLPSTQQPPPQKRERKPLATVDPNTNEEVSISPDSVSRSRSESTSEENVPSDQKSLPGSARDDVAAITDICLQAMFPFFLFVLL